MTADALLGIDFGGTKIGLGLADLTGEIVATTTLRTNAADGAEQALTRALVAAEVFCHRHRRRVAAVGVATMGITREDRVDLAPNVIGWEALRLPGRLAAAFAPAPVAIDNDVRAAALAELLWGELRDVRTGIYLNLGSGLAATLILGGSIFEGAHGAAGEIGYWSRSASDVIGAREGVAPLELYLGGAGTRDRARTELGMDAGIGELLESDDPAAEEFIEELFAEIAVHVANLVIAVDPDRLVVGGGYLRTPNPLLADLRDWIASHAPYPPEVRTARFGADAALAGAFALAKRRLESAQPSLG